MQRRYSNVWPVLGLGLSLLAAASASSEVITLDAVADTEIDQHVNRSGTNYGSATSIRVSALGTPFTNPVVSPESWGLIRWDLSSLVATAEITSVTLQLQQADGGVETVDVFVIDQGAWDESTVTWNSWAATTTSETQLGVIDNVAISGGVTTFTDEDLTEAVQGWVDGSRDNLGLLFKWSGAVGSGTDPNGYGDTYLTKEHTGEFIPPQLVVTYVVPEPGAMGMLLGGGVIAFARRRQASTLP